MDWNINEATLAIRFSKSLRLLVFVYTRLQRFPFLEKLPQNFNLAYYQKLNGEVAYSTPSHRAFRASQQRHPFRLMCWYKPTLAVATSTLNNPNGLLRVQGSNLRLLGMNQLRNHSSNPRSWLCFIFTSNQSVNGNSVLFTRFSSSGLNWPITPARIELAFRDRKSLFLAIRRWGKMRFWSRITANLKREVQKWKGSHFANFHRRRSALCTFHTYIISKILLKIKGRFFLQCFLLSLNFLYILYQKFYWKSIKIFKWEI